jgi:hypothetical protein
MLRPLLDSDKPIIKEWIARDPQHAGMVEEFFYRPDGFSFAIDDARGPVMYVKIEPLDAELARLHIQFDELEHRRNAVALVREWPAVRAAITVAKLRYLVFDSVSGPLIRFCQKRFGFTHVADTNDYFIDLKAGP